MEESGKDFIAQDTINPVINKEDVGITRDPLNVELADDKFLEYAKKLKSDADLFWDGAGATGYNLSKRREDNEKHLFGRQYSGLKRKKYQSTAQDNILYEAEAYLKAMAFSKMPDITVTPGDDSDDKKQVAKMLSKVVTSDLQSRERKRVLGLAFKHNPVYFTGIVKPFWNPQKGRFGDYDFKVVHPENITLDHRATSNDVRDMDFVFETCENTVKELVMKFPENKQEFFEELRKYKIFGDATDSNAKNENNEAGMNTKVKYIEVWFKWYDHPETGEKEEWEEIIGVGWYFHDVLFRKMRHPYWDWTGTPQTFSYEMQEIGEGKYKKVKKQATTEQMQQMLSGQPDDSVETETIFHNHLDYPEFPYILLGMDQWGKMPLDETSRIEQAIAEQQTYDKRNQQIDEIIDRSRGKDVFSSDEGLTKQDVADMDMADPHQKVLIRGKVNEMYMRIAGEQPIPAMFESITDTRERLFDKLGVHQATRGQVNSETAATNNQIAREGDFSRMDDLVDDTVNYTCEKMANWIMQFIKLFYTEAHFKRIVGPDGKWLNVMIHRDDVNDGMEVVISASGSDKLKAEQRAIDNAKMKLIDPYHYFIDTEESDPKGRTLALMTFLMNPQAYLMDIENGGDGSSVTNGMQAASQVVNGQANGMSSGQGDPQALQDIMQITHGQVPPPPQQISPGYMQTFTAFMQSPQVEQLIQQFGAQFKQQLLQFAQAVAQLSKTLQQPQGQPAQPQGIHPGAALGGGNQSAGPLTQQPSPTNPTQVAAVAPRPGM